MARCASDRQYYSPGSSYMHERLTRSRLLCLALDELELLLVGSLEG